MPGGGGGRCDLLSVRVNQLNDSKDGMCYLQVKQNVDVD